jgi:hypothetical protein
MPHNQATGMMADELRASSTIARQVLDSVYFLAQWNIIRLPFTVRTSTLEAVVR